MELPKTSAGTLRVCWIKALKLLENIRLKPHAKILDAGSGDGRFSKIIKSKFPKSDFHCIDFNQKLLNKIPKPFKKKKVNLNKKIPYKNETFDFVFTGGVIECLSNHELFLSELYRILKKDGKLLITTFNVVNLSNRVKVLFGKNPTPKVRKTLFTPKELRDDLNKNGFNIIATNNSGIPFPHHFPAPHTIKNIFIGLDKLFPNIAVEMLFLCQKKAKKK
ncbi:MAG: class I SAM-dependent methyltransferase [Nanoarchaeota archaeon]|nr:class I SAM-dependent methyltransferase [Nanoarchaeota archaeon]